MDKTSVYLDEADRAILRLLAEATGKSNSEIFREGLRAYQRECAPRRFSLINSGRGDGRSVADIPEEELMAGFGE